MTTSPQVELDDLLGLDINPNLGMFAIQSMEERNTSGSKTIDLCVKALVQAGLADDKAQALQHYNEISNNLADLQLVGADFDSVTYSQKMRMLRERLSDNEEDQNTQLFRQFGTLTHMFAYQLSAGRVPYQLTAEYQQEWTEWQQSFGLEQPSLPLGQQMPIMPERLFPNPAPLGDSLIQLRDHHYYRDLVKLRGEIQPNLNSEWTWKKRCRKLRPFAHELQRMLRPMLGSYMDRWLRYRNTPVEQSEYLANLTLVIWASLVQKAIESDEMLILPEVPVMHWAHRIGYRRVDGLVIETVNGKPLSRPQREIVRKCIDAVIEGKFKPASISHLRMALSQIFGGEVGASILDYKSAVGDFVNQVDYMIQPDSCPQQSHEKQIAQYLFLTSLDQHLLEGRNGNGTAWKDNVSITNGTLQYLLPAGDPLNIPIERSGDEQIVGFINDIVRELPRAERNGRIRELKNLYAGYALHQLDGKTGHASNIVSLHSFKTDNQPTLFVHADPLREVIEQHRTFLDSHSVIEIIHYRKKVAMQLHVDRLLSKIDNNEIYTRNFRNSRGGLIECLNPDHKDRNPSLSVNLRKGFFKCFTCGVKGNFNSESLNRVSHLDLRHLTWNRVRRQQQHLLGVTLSPRLHQLFLRTQELLQKHFRKSPGAKYIEEQRSISSELAYEYGAGYGTNWVIEALLENFKLEELMKYGLIRHRTTVTRAANLLPMLQGMGYSFEEATRPLEASKTRAEVKYGLPYFPFRDRVTFPLKLEGYLNNFYGRAAWDAHKSVKHYKMRIADDETYSQGGFNLDLLDMISYDDTHCDEIIMTESVIDALSLMMMGFRNVVAISGTRNYPVLEAIANADKPLAFALNNDDPGNEAATELIEWLRQERQFAYPIRNFTADFFARHDSPEDLRYTDYNDWWKNIGSQKPTAVV